MATGTAIRAHTPLVDGEEPAVFHHQAERKGGTSTGLTAVRNADGTVLTGPEAVEANISSYLEALFHGCHMASYEEAGPIDSGSTFTDDTLSPGLPTLRPEDREALERPFTLEAAVEASSSSKAPGLDALSYEFYKATIIMVGPPPPGGYNAMLANSLLMASMQQGVIRLLPKVPRGAHGLPAEANNAPLRRL